MRRVARRLRRRKRRLRLITGVLLLTAVAVLLLWRAPSFRVVGLNSAATPTPQPAEDGAGTMELHLPAQTWYTIQTGVFSTEEAAREKADEYADRGAPGTVVSSNGKWRVFIAAYGREADAASVRRRLGELQRVETYLYTWECPELRLRLSGPGAQLDAAAAGMTLLQGAAEIMRDTAMLLDASQLTLADALEETAELDGQLSLWMKTTRAAFGSSPPQFISALLRMAEDCLKEIASCRGMETAPGLSSALKAKAMELYDGMVSLRMSLLNQ